VNARNELSLAEDDVVAGDSEKSCDNGYAVDSPCKYEYSMGYVEVSAGERICKNAYLLPGAYMMNNTVLTVAIFCALMWLFMGIGIISDIFMEAIEVITAQTKAVEVRPGVYVDVEIWNATVANLTLMALGSSAPEILLSVIGTVSDIKAVPSKLGPSTIVGSAAFNLLVITAVSILAVGTKEDP
jgi:solute carrier family 8 (sodium/calcium exchanger)